MTTMHRPLVRGLAEKFAPDYDSPADMAEAVLREIGTSTDRLRAALAEVLPQYLSAYVSRTRNGVINARTAAPSAKIAAIRAWYPQFLAQTLYTESGWRRLGDCGRDDLLFAAAQRRDRAASELVRAAQYERLASLVGDGVVADLDEESVRSALDVTS